MLKIRRPLGRLIFNMGIAIPGKTVFLIETAPWETSTIPAENTKDTLMRNCTTSPGIFFINIYYLAVSYSLSPCYLVIFITCSYLATLFELTAFIIDKMLKKIDFDITVIFSGQGKCINSLALGDAKVITGLGQHLGHTRLLASVLREMLKILQSDQHYTLKFKLHMPGTKELTLCLMWADRAFLHVCLLPLNKVNLGPVGADHLGGLLPNKLLISLTQSLSLHLLHCRWS